MLFLSTLIKQRNLCFAILGFVGVHLTLVMLGIPSWICPIRAGIGVPCPGCGLSRAIRELFRGHWQHAIEIHAFAPITIGVGMLLVFAMLLQERDRRRLVQLIESIERQTKISSIFIGSFLGYWMVRLLFFTNDLYRLVM